MVEEKQKLYLNAVAGANISNRGIVEEKQKLYLNAAKLGTTN